MYGELKKHLQSQLDEIKEAGLFKKERVITSAQGAEISLDTGQKVINFCANNYLGLSSSQELIDAAKQGLDERGYGMSSVRFICGCQDKHKELERKIADFFHKEDTIMYAAAFDANGGVFEPLFTKEDAIISDALNHASIIDGVRLCKSVRYRYEHANMQDLEEQLKKSQEQRFRIIVTDGVFSMDGDVCKLNEIVALAKKYNALVMLDESHSAGVIGKSGRGTMEHFDIFDEVDIITGTLGKAFGGAIGGFTTAKKEIIEMLRQRSRPYLFSNSIPPSVVYAGIKTIDLLERSSELLLKLKQNTTYFMDSMINAGFDIKPTASAIVPIMLYDAKLSQDFASKLLEEGIYVIGFYYPVVAKGQARIRVQLSAAHTQQHLDKAIKAFTKIGKELGVI